MSIDKTYLTEPEVRVTNDTTGGQKGAKLTQVGALDPVSLIEVSRVAGMGANKYSAYNFMKGTDWSLMFNAMMRHMLRFWAGEDRDPESGELHTAHAAWMALALISFQLRDIGNDDRPPALPDPVEDAGITSETWGEGDGPVYEFVTPERISQEYLDTWKKLVESPVNPMFHTPGRSNPYPVET